MHNTEYSVKTKDRIRCSYQQLGTSNIPLATSKYHKTSLGLAVPRLRLNSAQFQLKLPTGAELGNGNY